MKTSMFLFLLLLTFITCKKTSPDNSANTSTPPINNNNNNKPSNGGNPADSLYNPVDPSITASQGFFLDGWQGKTFTAPSYNLISAPTDAATDTVNIDLNNVITKVPQYLFGNNVNPYMSQIIDQPILLNHIKNLSPNVLRFPGGNASSVYFWDATSTTTPADIADTLYDSYGKPYNALAAAPNNTYWYGKNTENWTISLDNYYVLLKSTNSTGIITVNYPYARYGRGTNPVATAAHYAANWVRYDRGRSKFWEIGNEVSGPWQAGFKINTRQNKDGQPETINGIIYGKHFKIFCDSMRKAAAEVGANIKIGAVIEPVDASNSWNQVSRTWNAEFFANAGNQADYFIVHDYFMNAVSSASVILNSAATGTKASLDYITANTAANGVQMKPIAMTEWNIWATGNKQMVSNIAGMHATLVLGEMLKNKFGMASRWDLANAWSNGDDHGMFNNINGGNPSEPIWNPRPAFYYMYYFQKCFGDRMVQSTVTSTIAPGDLVSFASSFESGQAGTILINKGTSNRIAAVNFKHFAAGTKYYWYLLTGGTDNGEYSQQVSINGLGPSSGIAGGPLNYALLNANAAPLSGTLKISVPARTVVFLVAEKKM
ncbi:MAG: alpha-L-arabinofuranosidase [Chitinophagaceae bacterium]|nr:alpha-L-arabinofuranosidase [Chitinophagaceae bacterium]